MICAIECYPRDLQFLIDAKIGELTKAKASVTIKLLKVKKSDLTYQKIHYLEITGHFTP